MISENYLESEFPDVSVVEPSDEMRNYMDIDLFLSTMKEMIDKLDSPSKGFSEIFKVIAQGETLESENSVEQTMFLVCLGVQFKHKEFTIWSKTRQKALVDKMFV